MKPGVERQATGTLPQARAVSTIVCATSGAVAWPATTSTSGSTGAGLKKCMPTTRSGRLSRPAIAVTDSDEVLVAMIVSASTSDSIWRSTATFTSRFSTMTSITRPTSASGASVPTGTQPRGDHVALGRSKLAALHALVEARADLADAAVERGRTRVAQVDAVAGGCCDLGDAAAHRAGADDDDGLVFARVIQPSIGSVSWNEGRLRSSASQSASRGAMPRQPKPSKR